jgi:hypothetical protein
MICGTDEPSEAISASRLVVDGRVEEEVADDFAIVSEHRDV